MQVNQVEAKAKFLTHCRRTVDEDKRTYVSDQSGRSFMVLDTKDRHQKSPAVKISAQAFKDNFSRYSSLVRLGVCFELTLKGRDGSIYARRHKDYEDPLDDVFGRWIDLVIEDGIKKLEPSETLRAIQRLDQKSAGDQEMITAGLQKLTKGLMRMALGHRPFDEGTSVPITVSGAVQEGGISANAGTS